MTTRIKKLAKKIRQKIDWIFILTGSCMITYGILDFSIVGGESLPFLSKGGKIIHAYGYFYTSSSRLTIAIGVSLLVFGILLYKDKRGKKYAT